MIDIEGLYDSLLDCSFRGVVFSVIDTKLEVGRRMQRELFPGLDSANFQDLGVLDGPIRVTGLVSGDDYVRQAKQLREAFRTPGPGSLVLPWLDISDVILHGQATISFADKELRIARFEASFLPFDPQAAAPDDTLQGLLDAVANLKAQARGYMRGLLAPLILPLAVFSYARSFVGQVASYWSVLTQGGLGLDVLGAAAAPAIVNLTSVPATYSADWPDTTVDAIAGIPDAIAAASVPVPPAAVGPGGSIETPIAADPRAATTLLLAGWKAVSPSLSDPGPGPGLTVATQALIVADAVSAASDISFASQQDAIAWRDRLVSTLDATIAGTARQAALDPAAAAATWRGLTALRAAFLADINTVIGRLPAVVIVQLPNSVPAWLVAQFLADGAPLLVRKEYLDIVARNQVRHPALVPAGAIETLA